MGASSSTVRDLAIDESNEGGSMKVSEAVARRIIGQPEENEPVQEPTYITPSQSDIQKEMERLRRYYDKKIEALEKQNKELHRIATEEFSKAVEDVEEKFIKTGPPRAICEELKDEVIKCYQENPKQGLLCSKIVRAYKTCVEEKRDSMLTRKDEECQPCILAQMARGPCGIHFMKAYDCYLENKDPDECSLFYMEMKECWEKYPSYGYEQIVDRAYKDTPKDGSDKDTTKENNNSSIKSEDVTLTEQS